MYTIISKEEAALKDFHAGKYEKGSYLFRVYCLDDGIHIECGLSLFEVKLLNEFIEKCVTDDYISDDGV